MNIQATRSAADDKIGIPIEGIFRLAKRRRPPLTPRPANIYGPFCLSSNSIVRAVSPVRDVDVVDWRKKKKIIYNKFLTYWISHLYSIDLNELFICKENINRNLLWCECARNRIQK